jgi:hypothetical protein
MRGMLTDRSAGAAAIVIHRGGVSRERFFRHCHQSEDETVDAGYKCAGIQFGRLYRAAGGKDGAEWGLQAWG